MDPINEATKDTGRTAVFAAISAVVSYALNYFFPSIPGEVIAAILVILTAFLVWLDSYIHHNPAIKANGLSPI